MDARKSAIFAFQFVKPALKTITHLIQYTVLEIQFNERPLFCFVLVLSSVIIAQ